jgi:4-alpha-glucanotransferase
MRRRGAGILLHATSLPGRHGAGDLGAGARAFADWLAAAGQSWSRSAEQAARERASAIEYLAGPGATRLAGPPHLELLRALYASVADTMIAPLQDVLGLGSDARMNIPGVAEGNWGWRIPDGALTEVRARELRALAALYERTEQS